MTESVSVTYNERISDATNEWQFIRTEDGKERVLTTVSLAFLETLSDYERRRFWRMFWHKFSLAGRRAKSVLSPTLKDGDKT